MSFNIKSILTRVNLLVFIFSIGKIISASGQTLFNSNHLVSYVSKITHTSNLLNHLPILTSLSTMIVVMITRLPSIHYQVNKFLSARHSSQNQRPNHSGHLLYLYYFLFSMNLVAGLFSCFGAYLGSITLLEYLQTQFSVFSSLQYNEIFTQFFSLMIGISAFVAYYSFNIHKAKLNIDNFILICSSCQRPRYFNRHIATACIIASLSMISVPLIAYFLTKNAIYRMPYLADFLSENHIVLIALLSCIATLTATLTTSLVATYDYVNNRSYQIQLPTKKWITLYQVNFFAGMFDCLSCAAGSFFGVIFISHDLLLFSLDQNLVLCVALPCALSTCLLNYFFSIRQGFYTTLAILNTK